MRTQELEHKAHGSGAQLLPSALFCRHSATLLPDVVWNTRNSVFQIQRSPKKGIFIQKNKRTAEAQKCGAEEDVEKEGTKHVACLETTDTEFLCWFLAT